MAKFIKTPVKGMCDQLPADMRLREHVLSMIKTSYSRFGFTQIETPVMEHIENLTSKQGFCLSKFRMPVNAEALRMVMLMN